MSQDLPDRMHAAAATMREADELLNPGYFDGRREYSWMPSQLEGAANRLAARLAAEAVEREAAQARRVDELAGVISRLFGHIAGLTDLGVTMLARKLDGAGYRKTEEADDVTP